VFHFDTNQLSVLKVGAVENYMIANLIFMKPSDRFEGFIIASFYLGKGIEWIKQHINIAQYLCSSDPKVRRLAKDVIYNSIESLVELYLQRGDKK